MPISVVVGGNTSKCSLGMTPFGSLSLTYWKHLRVREGTSVPFRAPLQELSALSPTQIHTLRACSLLAIPPPPGEGASAGRLPDRPLRAQFVRLGCLGPRCGGRPAGTATQSGPCYGPPSCCPAPAARSINRSGILPLLLQPRLPVQASQLVVPASWSQIMEQTPGYGLITSSGGMTTPSTSVAGMPGYVVPPLGLTPPDFSSWSLLPPEPPLPQGLPTALQGLSHIGRSIQVRATVERQAQAQLAQGPRGLAQRTQTPPMLAPHTPQMAPPLCQPPPGQPSTPYQQAVQPPGKSSGRGVTFDSPMDKTPPAGGQSSEDHGRQWTRGRGDDGRSASHPRVQEKTGMQPPRQEGDLPSRATPNIPPITTPEGTLPQLGGRPRTLPCDPTRLAARYQSVG